MSEYNTMIGGLFIEVDKIGGGQPGRTYAGDWTVTVTNGPTFVFDGEIFHMDGSKTHAQVAQWACIFASRRIDGGE